MVTLASRQITDVLQFHCRRMRQKLCRQHTDTVGRMTLSGAQDVTAAVEVAKRIARQ